MNDHLATDAVYSSIDFELGQMLKSERLKANFPT